jgi:hypothetical protein
LKTSTGTSAAPFSHRDHASVSPSNYGPSSAGG